jgi:transketolase
VEDWFTDNTPKRFEAYGWQVIPNIDGHQPDAILAAIEAGKAETGKPTLICCKTIIGKGSPNKQGKEECHGAPLGVDEIALVRETLGWSHPPFEIPADLLEDWNRVEKGTALENEWKQLFADYKAAHPELAAEFERRMAGELPADFEDRANAYIAEVNSKAETVATRKASQNCLNAFGPLVPELLGGSADLAPSNLTTWSGSVSIKDDAAGNYVHYGVREFGMTAIVNGIQLHGGLRPYGATFLIFMEYARNAVRMSALMKLPVIQVYTHDSIGLGEDGPTHQPIEQLSSLRTTPHMTTWRPCDAVEMAVAWKEALKSTDGPTCLIGSRQGLAHQQRSPEQMENIARGGYTLKESNGKPQVILIASGSEVALVMGAASQLEAAGHAVRVVSMPSVERFLRQSDEYQAAVLPLDVQARVAVEAGATTDWYRFTGLRGEVIGMTRFGESGPAEQLMKQFGFTVENIVNKAQALIGN